MSNPKSIYNEFIRANLPAGITYSGNRYRVNDKSFFTYTLAYTYLRYITAMQVYTLKLTWFLYQGQWDDTKVWVDSINYE